MRSSVVDLGAPRQGRNCPFRVVAIAPAAAAKRDAVIASAALGDGHGERATEGVTGAGGVDRADGEGLDVLAAGGRLDVDASTAQRGDHGRDPEREESVSAAELFALVLVGDHDRTVRQQLLGQLRRRRRVENRQAAEGTSLSEGIDNDGDRDLQLAEDNLGVGQGSGAQQGVGAGDHDDRVLPSFVDGDQRPTGRRGGDALNGSRR